MTKSKIFLYFCLSFIGGIFLSSTIFVPALGFSLGSRVYLLLPGLILGILLISILWQYKKIVVIGFCILFLVAGIYRHQQAELKIINNELKSHNDTGKEIILTGVISKEADIRSNNIKLIITPEEIQNAANLQNAENRSRHFEGRVLVTTNRYPEYQYGDKLKITGELKAPIKFEDFNYKDYLAKDGIYSVMYYPKIKLLEREKSIGPTYVIYSQILSFKNKLMESIYQNLSPPQSSILGAVILGDKRKISDEWKQKLNIVGVRHITAVSGMHVAILTTILMTLLLGLGFWRQQAFYFTIVFVAFFVIMTGLQPSAIRAGIMGGLFLLAQYLGRQKFATNALLLAAVVMLAINPLLLKLDVGFQLSFLAVLGIIYLMPIFQYYFRKWLSPEWFQKCWWLSWLPIKSIGDILAMTLSAQVFTLPILIYNFGYMFLVAPITNLLIVPFLSYIMGLGFLFGIFGIISQFLGWVFSWPAWLLLTYLTKIVDFFSQIPLAFITIENLHWAWLIIAYLILGYFTWRISQKQKLKFLNY